MGVDEALEVPDAAEVDPTEGVHHDVQLHRARLFSVRRRQRVECQIPWIVALQNALKPAVDEHLCDIIPDPCCVLGDLISGAALLAASVVADLCIIVDGLSDIEDGLAV